MMLTHHPANTSTFFFFPQYCYWNPFSWLVCTLLVVLIHSNANATTQWHVESPVMWDVSPQPSSSLMQQQEQTCSSHNRCTRSMAKHTSNRTSLWHKPCAFAVPQKPKGKKKEGIGLRNTAPWRGKILSLCRNWGGVRFICSLISF